MHVASIGWVKDGGERSRFVGVNLNLSQTNSRSCDCINKGMSNDDFFPNKGRESIENEMSNRKVILGSNWPDNASH
jgi:hypothetical protein